MANKRIATAISICLALLIALSGCGGGSASPTQDSAAPDIGTQESAAAESPASEAPEPEHAGGAANDLDPVELRWYIIGDGQPVDMELVMEDFNARLKEKINATLDLQVIDWGNFDQKINVMSSAAEPFDLCFSSGWTNFYGQAAQGFYADLTDLLSTYAPGTLKVVSQELFDAFKVKGQIQAVPNLQGMTYKDYVLFNKDLAEKYNIPDKVDGLEGLEEYFEAIKAGEPQLKYIFYLAGMADTSMGYFTYGNPDPMKRPYSIAGSGTYKLLQPDGSLKVVWAKDAPGTMENFKWKRKAYLNGWIPSDILTLQFNRDEFLNGNAAAVYIGLNPDDSKTQSNWGTNFKAVDIGMKNILYSDMVSGAATSISYHSQNKERAMMLLELVNTDPETFNTLILGVEGTHWVRDENNVWSFAPGVDETTTGYPMTGYGWSIGNDFLKFPMAGTDPETPKAVQAFDASAEVEPAIGFVPDLEPVTTQLANIWTLNDEFGWPLLFGLVDPETALPDNNARMEEAGIQDVVDEMQRQLDAYIAENR